jgi:hypothetical protein
MRQRDADADDGGGGGVGAVWRFLGGWMMSGQNGCVRVPWRSTHMRPGVPPCACKSSLHV